MTCVSDTNEKPTFHAVGGGDILSQDIKFLKGVGPARASVLRDEAGVSSFRDLLYFFPYKYIDRSVVYTISQLQENMPYVQLKGHILDFATEGEGRKKRLKAVFTDGTGYVELIWFAGIKYVEKTLKVNQTYLLLGKPSSYNGRFSFPHPELETVTAGESQNRGLQSTYHITDKMKRSGFTSKTIRELVARVFDVVKDRMTETLPPYFMEKHRLVPLHAALWQVHFPQSATSLPAAQRRLKFEELFYLQLDILRYAKDRELSRAGFLFPRVGRSFMQFYKEKLPFELTGAQKRVMKEIRKDMVSGHQMNRLLQGDVGSGKTMVAFMACLIAIDNGFQACIMAPTEILAEQHLETLQNWLEGLDVETALLTGNVTGARRKKVLDDLASGKIKLLVGTHALIEPSVHFLNLGLAVIDEQHRFGVRQRARLWMKNTIAPHVLVMTATPIPRTLAMTVYGDLDVSVIDELPPGRKPVKTLHYYSENHARLYDGIRHEIKAGRQAYFVFPLIEENEKSDLKNLELGYEHLLKVFPEFHIGKIHGRMKPAEKEQAMREFAANHTNILVSTTVIEVGVNVPNASVMVIEDANRFGLAQLHQLRGRVGRGAEQSYCILVTKRQLSENTRRRMTVMVETNDGFEIAEEDMRLRGPGDIEGTQQSGLPFELKIANLVKDSPLLAEAREAAREILKNDPYEKLPQNDVIWTQLRCLKKQIANFSAIS